MPKLIPKNSFLRQSAKITKKLPSLETKILKALRLLHEDSFSPSLKTHKLSGNLNDKYACSVSDDIRIVFTISDDTIHLLNIGSHDEVY
ncbi:type II toxin-antitoxin system YafQ family toxin [Candidatus Magnetominusculus dajiuhuensis]|uniref:type II toxin-antitoxin system RelE/ParE family toxin n=1 Tax=Candidatus Magnetominusculus dajiuhuensis TaxID=3137712 RepID=UPI003B4354B0